MKQLTNKVKDFILDERVAKVLILVSIFWSNIVGETTVFESILLMVMISISWTLLDFRRGIQELNVSLEDKYKDI